MYSYKILNIASPNISLQHIFSKELGISKILAQVLVNRGIKNVTEAEKFIHPKLGHLLDPSKLPDMPKAVELIKRAAKHKEKVMVFGDYDVDGITSLVLLKTTLSKLGLDTFHYLPHRIDEGYGLNKNILQVVKQKGIRFLITVDCGTTNCEQIKELRRHNIKVIVTDHHEPLDGNLPPACAIINPKLKNSSYAYRDLAGVAVAYKLCQAITHERLFEDLDLVSLGTIADVVPLTGENRIIVKEGLSWFSQTQRIGLKALIKASGLKEKKISSTFVGFILGPRINASGRIDTAETAFNLLMSQAETEADELAKIIEGHNHQRQKIEAQILKEAEAIIEQEINFKVHKVIVIAKEGWHPGVLGIVASKLVDRFYRPVIVISLTKDLCKGSARSINNFHLFQALCECRDTLKTFGGHSHAAGLLITRDNLENFKHSINRLAGKRLLLEDLLPRWDIDMELDLADLDEAVISELGVLEPFGRGNAEPLFYTRNLKLKSEPQVLGKNTLKFWVSDSHTVYPAIGFGMANFKTDVLNANYFDLVYTPRMDSWGGDESVILEVKDIFFK